MSVFTQIYKDKFEKIEEQANLERGLSGLSVFETCKETVLNSFNYIDLPEHIYFRLPEIGLFYRGLAGGFIDDNGLFRIYPASGAGVIDENGEFTTYMMTSPEGKTFYRKREEVALLRNNTSQLPSAIIIAHFVNIMEEALKTVEINIVKARGGDLFKVTDEQALKVIAEAYEDMKKGKPFMALKNNDILKSLEHTVLFDNRSTDILAQFEIYNRVNSLFLQFYGINSNADPKRERMIVDEVNANNEARFVGPFGDMVENRKRFVEEVKRKFSGYVSESFAIEPNRDTGNSQPLTGNGEETFKEETFSQDVEEVEQEGGGNND